MRGNILREGFRKSKLEYFLQEKFGAMDFKDVCIWLINISSEDFQLSKSSLFDDNPLLFGEFISVFAEELIWCNKVSISNEEHYINIADNATVIRNKYTFQSNTPSNKLNPKIRIKFVNNMFNESFIVREKRNKYKRNRHDCDNDTELKEENEYDKVKLNTIEEYLLIQQDIREQENLEIEDLLLIDLLSSNRSRVRADALSRLDIIRKRMKNIQFGKFGNSRFVFIKRNDPETLNIIKRNVDCHFQSIGIIGDIDKNLKNTGLSVKVDETTDSEKDNQIEKINTLLLEILKYERDDYFYDNLDKKIRDKNHVRDSKDINIIKRNANKNEDKNEIKNENNYNVHENIKIATTKIFYCQEILLRKESGSNYAGDGKPRVNCVLCLKSVLVEYLKKHYCSCHGYRHKNNTIRTIANGYRTADEINVAEGCVPSRWIQCDSCFELCYTNKLIIHKRDKCVNRIAVNINDNPINAEPAEPAQIGVGFENVGDQININIDDEVLVPIPYVAPIPEAPVVDPAPLIDVVDIDIGISQSTFRDLASSFRLGLYYFHYSWKDLIRSIMTSLLSSTIDANEIKAARAILAFQMLPGMIEVTRRRKDLMRTIDFLRAIDSSADSAIYVIQTAVIWKSKYGDRPGVVPKEVTVELLKARVERLISQGRISNANRILLVIDELLDGIQIPEAVPDEEYAIKIKALHPAANEFDTLPLKENDPPIETSLQLNSHEVRESVYQLKKNSSAGNTGWTPYLILKILDDRKDINFDSELTLPHHLFDALTAFYNKILRGEFRGICRQLIIRKFVILIPKSDGSKSRPIGLLDCVLRLMGNCAVGKACLTLGNKLEPLQFGIGKKRGAQLSVSHSQLAFNKGDTLLVGDCRNAFNEMRLLMIYLGLQKYCPSLLRYFRMECELPMAIENHKGDIIGYSETGATQGSPFGSFFFCVGFQPVLVDIDLKKKEFENLFYADNPHIPISPSFVKATADDVIINGHPSVMAMLAHEMPVIYNVHNLTLNVTKSKMAGLNLDASVVDFPEGIQTSNYGLISLGCAVGTDDFIDAYVNNKMISFKPPFKAMQIISPQSALQITVQCLNSKPDFLFSVAKSMKVIEKYTKQYDKYMIQVVSNTLSIPILDDNIKKMGIEDTTKFKEELKKMNPEKLKEELKKLNISL